jgi:hypothetical protein
LVEQPIRNRQVTGSSPVVGSMIATRAFCAIPALSPQRTHDWNRIKYRLSTDFHKQPLVLRAEHAHNRLKRQGQVP